MLKLFYVLYNFTDLCYVIKKLLYRLHFELYVTKIKKYDEFYLEHFLTIKIKV